MFQVQRTPEVHDVVVIGSGAGGGTAVKALTDLGMKVTLLEAGPMLNPATDFKEHMWPWEVDHRGVGPNAENYFGKDIYPFGYFLALNGFWNIPGEPFTVAPGNEFKWFRSRILGGRTNHFGRISLRFSDYDFKPQAFDGLGTDWPVTYDEMSPWYDVAEEFIGDGPLFATQGRHPDSQRVYRSASRKAISVPIVVLVNGNSASAAEIVTAALQDRGRAVVVGTTSYGKGTVQTVLRMPNEGELILTWSRLLAPSGYTWNELGVMPNICTAKVADVNKLTPEIDASRALLTKWHAEREPSSQEVANMRKICAPGEDTPERDVEIAGRVLRDPVLYAQAVKSGAVDQAARP